MNGKVNLQLKVGWLHSCHFGSTVDFLSLLRQVGSYLGTKVTPRSTASAFGLWRRILPRGVVCIISMMSPAVEMSGKII